MLIAFNILYDYMLILTYNSKHTFIVIDILTYDNSFIYNMLLAYYVSDISMLI